MKSLIVALVPLALACMAAQAQEEELGLTGKGIKLGATWSSLNTNVREFRDGESLGGFSAGAFLTYNVTPDLAIQPELMYAEKGGGKSLFLTSDGFRIRYVEIPVLLKYRLVRGAKATPSLFLGPAVSALASAKLFHHGLFDYYDYDVKDGMKSPDFCIVVGCEIAFKAAFGPVRPAIDVRYSLGLVNAIDPTAWNEGRRIVDEGEFLGFPYYEYDRPILGDDAHTKCRAFSVLISLAF